MTVVPGNVAVVFFYNFGLAETPVCASEDYIGLMSGTIRAFIAFELPADVLDRVQSLQEKLKTLGLNVRWVRPGNLHLTLKFLGNIARTDIESVRSGLSAAIGRFSPIALSLKGIGVFPGVRRPRVLWVGIAGEVQMLAELQATIEDVLAPVGIARENRKFKAHLTLGRFKGSADARKLGEAIAAFNPFSTDVFEIDRLFLFQSELKPTGPEYTRLMNFPLGK